jgi:2-phosphosulfolactate phosphatase
VLAEFLQLMGSYEPEDGALIALSTRRTYTDPLDALQFSAAAQALRQIGLEEDVPLCAQDAKTPAVPQLMGRVAEALELRRGHHSRNNASGQD